MSTFSLLCQAAHLLGQVLQQVASDSTGQDVAWMQLDRTLQSMLAAALDVNLPDYDQITFIYRSAICS
jgi:DNA polymerase elongation subunit (family B)